MATSRLHELLPAFGERNQVLVLLLGLMSLTSRWMGLLESQARSARLESSPSQTSEEADLGLIYFLLGTISFSHHYQELIRGIQPPPATQESAPAGSDVWGDLRGLLR